MIYRILCSWVLLTALFFVGCSPAGHNFSALKSSDPAIRRDAALQLNYHEAFSKRSVPMLLRAAEDRDPVVRECALKAIGKLPARTEGVSAVIRLALNDSNLGVKRTAAAVFSSMNPVPAEILIPLAETLGDKDSLLYSYVTSTFMDLGPLGVSALVHTCKSKNQELRCRAAATLGFIGCDAKRALPMLNEMLGDQDDLVRSTAKTSIDKIQLAYVCSK